MRIFGVILAGGDGRRMGGADKALLSLSGYTLLSRVIARAEPQVARLALSANGNADRFAGYDLPVLADSVPLGPLSGILAALRWAAPLGATAVVSFAVDTPFFPGDLVPRLCLAAETAPQGLAIAHSGKDHPTFGLWPVDLTAALSSYLDSGVKPRVMGFAEAQVCGRADFPEDGAFANLNTPDDLAQAERLLRD